MMQIIKHAWLDADKEGSSLIMSPYGVFRKLMMLNGVCFCTPYTFRLSQLTLHSAFCPCRAQLCFVN